MTALELASRVGLTENAIRKLEAGDSKEPRFSTGLRIARELDVAPEALTGDEVREKSGRPELAAIIRRIRGHRADLVKRGIAHVRVFGSVARGDARTDSDIDVMLEPAAGARFSLVDLADTEVLLQRVLSHKVDALTVKTLEKAPFAESAFNEAVDVF